jgi:thymidylate synthase (FAD)
LNQARQSVPEADAILGLYFPVLDHGFVSLVDYMGGDLAVERAARTSYHLGEETRPIAKTRDLIRYLIRHRHSSPFEMTEMVFHIGMPIFVARQYVRHRTASMNEYSARHAEVQMLFYTPEHDQVCVQSAANKQGRGDSVSAMGRWRRPRPSSGRA